VITSYFKVLSIFYTTFLFFFLIHHKERTKALVKFMSEVHTLEQGNDESARDFGDRCIDVFWSLLKILPRPEYESMPADYVALSDNVKKEIHTAHMRAATDGLCRASFISGVNHFIKLPLMIENPANLSQAIKAAETIEWSLGTVKLGEYRISKLAQMEDADLEGMKDLDGETICAINRYRSEQGIRPFKRFNSSRRNGNGYYKPNAKPICRNCRKPGHIQKYCRA
jgi:hypothetical protein